MALNEYNTIKNSNNEEPSSSSVLFSTILISDQDLKYKEKGLPRSLLAVLLGVTLLCLAIFSTGSIISTNTVHTDLKLESSDSLVETTAHSDTEGAVLGVFPPNSCNQVSACNSNCDTGGGPLAHFNCQESGASCTPFSFMPNVQACQNQDWLDKYQYRTKDFFHGGDYYKYQAYQDKKDKGDDLWIVHGCDGAGIQTDCLGDVLYLENFKKDPVAPQNCPLSTYGDITTSFDGKFVHDSCPTFDHPGMQKTYQDYNCGWWRGYKDPIGIEAASKDGVGAYGPAGAEGAQNLANDLNFALKNVYQDNERVSSYDGTQHPFQDASSPPLQYFVGAVYPWICNYEDDSYLPWTGGQVNCYCDNEPWNGRNGNPMTFAVNMRILYCGLYDSDDGGKKMVCDLLEPIRKTDNGLYTELIAKGFELEWASFP